MFLSSALTKAGSLTLSDEWQTLGTVGADGVFLLAAWRANTGKMAMRVLLDGVEIVPELDLDELAGSGGLKLHSGVGGLPISTPVTNTWVYRPSLPIRVNTSLALQFKRTTAGGTKAINYMLVEWGQR